MCKNLLEGGYLASPGARGELLYTKYTLTCVQDLVEGAIMPLKGRGMNCCSVHQVHFDCVQDLVEGGYLASLGARGELLYTKYTLTCVQDLVDGGYLASIVARGE